MGAVPRLPQPLRWLAGTKTNSLNTMFTELAKKNELTFAPIARETGPKFRADPSLFAVDKFHPNDRGYVTWMPVLESALNEALSEQPDHC